MKPTFRETKLEQQLLHHTLVCLLPSLKYKTKINVKTSNESYINPVDKEILKNILIEKTS